MRIHRIAGTGVCLLVWMLAPCARSSTSSGPRAGDDDRADISNFLMQYFLDYNMADSWFITSAPIITAN